MHTFINLLLAAGAVAGWLILAWCYLVINFAVKLPKRMPSWVFLVIIGGGAYLMGSCLITLTHRYPYDPKEILSHTTTVYEKPSYSSSNGH